MTEKMTLDYPKRKNDSFAFSKRVVFSLLCLIMLIFQNTAKADHLQPTIAIIIDDMGNHWVQAQRLINMPYPLTLAFLPHRKHTNTLARKAFRKEKEIMLHAPMENTVGLPLGAGALTLAMPEENLKRTLRQSLEAIPYIQGVNNHMGSMLTQNKTPMTWVMEEINRYPLYFVDSRTIASSVAAKISRSHGIPTLVRDVFLDHVQDKKAISQQFDLLLKKARDKGFAIAIGHPHTVTVSFLEEALPKLDEQGIAVATVSGLWSVISQGQPMFENRDKRLQIDRLVAKRVQLVQKTLTQ